MSTRTSPTTVGAEQKPQGEQPTPRRRRQVTYREVWCIDCGAQCTVGRDCVFVSAIKTPEGWRCMVCIDSDDPPASIG